MLNQKQIWFIYLLFFSVSFRLFLKLNGTSANFSSFVLPSIFCFEVFLFFFSSFFSLCIRFCFVSFYFNLFFSFSFTLVYSLSSFLCLSLFILISFFILIKQFWNYIFLCGSFRKPYLPLTILTGKNCVLLNSVEEWLLGYFWPFSCVYTIS